MKKFLLVVILLFVAINSTYAQKTFMDYKYVIVPESFDFVSGKDPFQLSSMTKFYLNKYGFNAYFNNEAPNTDRCEGLYADLLKGKGMFKTRISLTLKDCTGKLIYQTEDGISTLKEWKSAYPDALRKSMNTLESIDVSTISEEAIKKSDTISVSVTKKQIDDTPVENVVTEVKVTDENHKNDTKVTTTVTNTEKQNTTQVVEVTKPLEDSIGPSAKFSSYSFEGMVYLLRKTSQGYSFYKEVDTATGLELQGQIKLQDKSYVLNTENSKFDVLFTKDAMKIFRGDAIEVYSLKN